jgi:cation:H+ antiporter
MGIGKCWLLVVGGLVMIIVGARVLVPAASEIALRLGVPDDVIAATMVAFGTSLPELMTAIAAVRKGHPEITVGNIVGADVLNCLFVIGAAAVASPLAIPENFYYFHFPAMLVILFSFRAFISMNRSGVFHRWQGIWLLAVYIVYVVLGFALNVESAHPV